MRTIAKATGAMNRALQGIKALIISGDLSPGEQVRQEEMAEQLNVSRVPLREALNVLADQGLLFHRPHQGYFVTKRAQGEYAQIRRMLHLLESELMLSIRWPDDALLYTLRKLNAEMRVCVEQADIQRLIEINREFHFWVFSLSPNNLILEEVRRLWSMLEPPMWNKFERAEDRQSTLLEHDRLIAALEACDRSRCMAELERHRYSPESGMPIELPGAAPDMPEPRARAKRHTNTK
ncbi:GntR family transcriptional regulator [Eoetvoesiella caeni]